MNQQNTTTLNSKLRTLDYIVGIDEVGRGPLAGPVAVCAIMSRGTLDIKKAFPGVDDSKRLSPTKREEIFERVVASDIRYAVSYQSAETIDSIGITRAVHTALYECIATLEVPKSAFIYLDGLLHAPDRYAQETVIHGDALVPIISLASIIAKVSRDHWMEALAHEYPGYGFEKHKGYGTAEHIAMIRALGPAPIHRRSFLSRILGSSAVR